MTIRRPTPTIFTEQTAPSRADVQQWREEALASTVTRIRSSYIANGFHWYAPLDVREIEAHLHDALDDATHELCKVLEDN